MSATRPVRLDRGTGVTRNISASGIFFETDVDFAPGSAITFSIELSGPQGEKLMLKSRGENVRLEIRGDKMGVAAKIMFSKLENNDPPTSGNGS
jgi:hypothetical protein